MCHRFRISRWSCFSSDTNYTFLRGWAKTPTFEETYHSHIVGQYCADPSRYFAEIWAFATLRPRRRCSTR